MKQIKIGLWSDCHNFPSIPLMKLSAYHKQRGDNVDFANHLEHYDLVYASKVFSFTPDIEATCIINADEIKRSGTGYCISVVNGKEIFDKSKNNTLPDEIEHIYPDYSLYPKYKFASGFLTRGCPRGCGFCVVGKKEGLCSRQVADLSEFWREQKEIKLLDPNLLACNEHEKILERLADSKASIDLKQGFKECFRVLKPNGILIFKWNETDIKTSEIISLSPIQPLFGHKSGKLNKTHWLVFMKRSEQE